MRRTSPRDGFGISTPNAVPSFDGQGPPQVGSDEFIELADTWGYADETKAAIRAAIEREPNAGPVLTRYRNPRPSKVTALEELAAELFGVPYVLAVNSGTSALNTAYVAAGIGPGCEVIVPAYTFIATAAEVVTARAIPVVAEVDESLTLNPEDVERKITPRTKAIVPVHMNGAGADMDALLEIARRHDLLVIEDAAQACGASYKGRLLGTIGDLGCFSLSSYKMTGAGEAGLVMTSDRFLYMRAQSNHDTGALWRPDRFATEREAGELFCGYNFRMSELEGAVNLVQLRKMPAQIERCKHVKRRITAQLAQYADLTPQTVHDPQGEVGNHLTFFASDSAVAQAIVAALRTEGLPAWSRAGTDRRDWHIYSYWQHILEQRGASLDGCPWTCEKNLDSHPRYSPDMCPQTLELLGRAVFMSLDQWWTNGDCDRVAATVNRIVATHCRRLTTPPGWYPAANPVSPDST